MKNIVQRLKTASRSLLSSDSDPNAPFAALGLLPHICRAVEEDGYNAPTPIQSAAIPYVLEGRDLLGCAQTGTGKTAAFALPILHRLAAAPHSRPGIKTLILTPTRELAIQIGESFSAYGRHLSLKTAVIFGGVGAEPQRRALKAGVDILVATPGRYLDLKSQGCINIGGLEILVLDEADRMLDMGFIHDVKRIIGHLPAKRQNLLFSATMPKEVASLAFAILKNPAKVEVAPVSSTNASVRQSVYFVDKGHKRSLLLHVLADTSVTRALVFTRTKNNANRVAEFLCKNGIRSEAIHGNKSQSARQRALENFRQGATRILVASDIAARGLDIDAISHVINYEIPNVPETYVHRIGRTGRAEAQGIALSFCDGEERAFLRDIERVTGKKVPVIDEHPFPALEIPAAVAFAPRRPAHQKRHHRPRPQGGKPRGSRPQRS